jgi:predicted nucleotidyltransferase component of viral defense system
MGEEFLKDWQRKALQYVFSHEEASGFYLTGGTALAAFYLNHRFSDDLDFFSPQEFSTLAVQKIADGLRGELGAERPRYSRLHDRRQFFYMLGGEEIKIEFSFYPFPLLQPAQRVGTIVVDSEFDIAVNKLMTLTDRFDPKDFVDLYFLLSRYPLDRLRQGVAEKFGIHLDPVFLGGELVKVNRIAALPTMIRSLSVKELQDFFLNEAEKLRSEIIESE